MRPVEPKISLEGIPAARTAQEANRWFTERAHRVTVYNADRHHLDQVTFDGTGDGTVIPIPYELFHNELDSTTVAIAKLERHSEADVHDVNEFLLRSQVRSKVGTTSEFPCIRTGGVRRGATRFGHHYVPVRSRVPARGGVPACAKQPAQPARRA